jgi:hypothetical protein
MADQEQDQQQAPLGEADDDGKAAGAEEPKPKPEKAKGPKQTTRYIVLWAAVPSDPEEALRFRIHSIRVGSNKETVERAAWRDEDSEHYGAMRKAAKDHGVQIRAVNESAWGDPDRKPVRIDTVVKEITPW